MAGAPDTAEMLKKLARVVKGVKTLYRKGSLRSDRVDDPLTTMALRREEVHRFEWVLDRAQRRELLALRRSSRDIEDWITDALAAAKGAVPKERRERLLVRCREGLSELQRFLAFDPFRVTGKPDKDVVRGVPQRHIERIEEISAELRDCIERAGELPRATPAATPGRAGTTERAGAERPPATEASAPAAQPAVPNVQITFVAPGVEARTAEPAGRTAPARKRRTVKKAARGRPRRRPTGAKARKKPAAKRRPAAHKKRRAKPAEKHDTPKARPPDDAWLMKAPTGLHRHTAQKLWEAALKLESFRRAALQEAAGIGESPAKRFLAFAEGEGKLRTNRSERKTDQEAIIYTVAAGSTGTSNR